MTARAGHFFYRYNCPTPRARLHHKRNSRRGFDTSAAFLRLRKQYSSRPAPSPGEGEGWVGAMLMDSYFTFVHVARK